ncbi:site-specific recombinase [Verminephrobacter aporrectodeae]|uniref:site-specific recombinase n=1 Tax=Verminephrobacter aporrectodeae TaxID=1110389 RepID=UPI00224430D0|nr:site-specific recombinase [Verminephrobacter aporrectodeae]MCW8177327.1 recombinase [Verminephrobacter aporrectodeae subsp. tuberculatae]MCW8204829.1 recombinase [Verminephrobacter aporrectodeae subsp. tuberculatae]
MKHRATTDLATLLAALDPEADLAQRHLWLIELLDWVRGARDSVPATVARVQEFLDAVQARPEIRLRWQAWWAALLDRVDITTLLADFGFAPRTGLLSEMAERLRTRLLPASPETLDASELFMLALPCGFDAQWLAALGEAPLQRLAELLTPAAGATADTARATRWQQALLDAITYCAGQILATGFVPEMRLRMSASARAAQPFHMLIHDVEDLRVQLLHAQRNPEHIEAAAQRLRERLEACRAAAATVYAHFEENGVSVGLVFRLRQLRVRILRVRELLDCLLSPRPAAAAARLMVRLVVVGQERRSLRALLAANSSLLAAKVAERSAERGEHYIARTGAEYRTMLRKAAGGGALMAGTTLIKLWLHALALSAFWGGFLSGVNFTLSFVLIQLLHFTVATKQPAMTAPAMAVKLKELGASDAIESFVDEIAHLVRSQVAAILGNMLAVLPAVLGLAALIAWASGSPIMDRQQAEQALASLHLLGPSLGFAAFTGVLLFASSIVAGWAENWFVLNRLHSALHYNPRITRRLGTQRAARWACFLRENISGFAASISLGFMLGLVPVFAKFFGIGLDVRHVTLSTGQVAAASAVLGPQVLHLPAFWWAVAALPLFGALNVSVSFYLAFRLAMRAQNVSGVDRARIYAAMRARMLRAPWGFFLPARRARP